MLALLGDNRYVGSVDIDGSTSYGRRSSQPSGVTDSKLGLVSVWFKIDTETSTSTRFLTGSTTTSATGSQFRVGRNGFDGEAKVLSIVGDNAAGTTVLELRTTATFTDTNWHHLVASWDLADSGKRHLYVDGVSDLSVVKYINDSIDHTTPYWGIGAYYPGTFGINGRLAELYFAEEYLDLSVAANLAKFITSGGKPEYLGETGAIPTGSQPLLYHCRRSGDLATAFFTNRGSGGDFTVVGTPTVGSSSPSD